MEPQDIKERLACLLVAETVITVLAMLFTAWLATACLTTDPATSKDRFVISLTLFLCAIALIMLLWHAVITVKNLILTEKTGSLWLLTSLANLQYLAWETTLSPICFLRKHISDVEDAINIYLKKRKSKRRPIPCLKPKDLTSPK